MIASVVWLPDVESVSFVEAFLQGIQKGIYEDTQSVDERHVSASKDPRVVQLNSQSIILLYTGATACRNNQKGGERTAIFVTDMDKSSQIATKYGATVSQSLNCDGLGRISSVDICSKEIAQPFLKRNMFGTSICCSFSLSTAVMPPPQPFNSSLRGVMCTYLIPTKHHNQTIALKIYLSTSVMSLHAPQAWTAE